MGPDEVLAKLHASADAASVAGMARFGISPDKALGVRVPMLRALAREIGRDHELALVLWGEGLRETRILASIVADPTRITPGIMDAWAGQFQDWELCDQCCMNLFRHTSYGHAKAVEWSAREEEFVKRAGFSLMATLAVGDKKASDDVFEAYLPLIEREAGDGRNGVKKAVNWALRQIGKRDLALNAKAIACAERVKQQDTKAARWVAGDALRELTSGPVQQRLQEKAVRRG
ncbi:MAG: DNA alkylation repair protein [Candidatus Undinarchaeales archaeon]|jgi:3-methyladenine DNA glycosylase AlkD|nr:DNA alkylation repair protein [Candidatus Undinarchaeales archaeon]MDP7491828.1 DNA alkylation repair protein [Candidatus Undinarchaeales archaeon]